MARVQKWGNSQGLRLAKRVLKDADISVGDDVEVSARKGQIVLRKVSKPKFDLAEMVSRMPSDHQVEEHSFGKRVGKEEW